MKSRLFKIIAITVGLIVVAIVAFIIFVFLSLPSASQIAKALRPAKPTARTANVQNTNDKEKNPSIDSATDRPAESQTQNSSPEKDTNVGISKEQLLSILSDDSKPLSTVCQHIANIDQKQNSAITAKEFGNRIELSLEEKSHDPLMESFLPILKFTFTRPTFKQLLDEIKNLNPTKEEADSLMQKASFYSRAVQAYRELVSEKPQMEKIVDQSYLLMMLGRAVDAKPELRGDARLQDYCDQIESGLNTKQFPDFERSKQAFSDFLNETGIDAKSIGYDPNYKTELKYDLSAKGLHFSGGWLDTVFTKPATKN